MVLTVTATSPVSKSKCQRRAGNTDPLPQGQPSTQSSLLWVRRMGWKREERFSRCFRSCHKGWSWECSQGKSREGGTGVTQHPLMNPVVLHSAVLSGKVQHQSCSTLESGISREGASWSYICRIDHEFSSRPERLQGNKAAGMAPEAIKPRYSAAH